MAVATRQSKRTRQSRRSVSEDTREFVFHFDHGGIKMVYVLNMFAGSFHLYFVCYLFYFYFGLFYFYFGLLFDFPFLSLIVLLTYDPPPPSQGRIFLPKVACNTQTFWYPPQTDLAESAVLQGRGKFHVAPLLFYRIEIDRRNG